jgi:hypothetical protein
MSISTTNTINPSGYCPLDPEYAIDVNVADSPMFAAILTHWQGDSETVAELQGHLYQEVIDYTRTERHVVTIRTTPDHKVVQHAEQVQEKLTYIGSEPGGPVASFTVAQTGPMRAIRVDDPPPEITEDPHFKHFDAIDTAWDMEAIRLRKRRFRRTRIFFQLVWTAYKTARSS